MNSSLSEPETWLHAKASVILLAKEFNVSRIPPGKVCATRGAAWHAVTGGGLLLVNIWLSKHRVFRRPAGSPGSDFRRDDACPSGS